MADILDPATLEAFQPVSVAAVREQNGDLPERLARLGIAAEYDPEPDTLLLTIGTPQAAITESIDNWIGLRLEPTTGKLLGLDLLSLRASRPAEIGAVVQLLCKATAFGRSGTSKGAPIEAAQQLAAAVWALTAVGEAGAADERQD